jgi:uncharacterized protein (DUF433 family)
MTADEPLIQKTPGVLGGDACIRRTRISVWMLVNAWRLGFTDEELLNRYLVPLTREDLAAAREYHATHPDEIDEAIRRNEEG